MTTITTEQIESLLDGPLASDGEVWTDANDILRQIPLTLFPLVDRRYWEDRIASGDAEAIETVVRWAAHDCFNEAAG